MMRSRDRRADAPSHNIVSDDACATGGKPVFSHRADLIALNSTREAAVYLDRIWAAVMSCSIDELREYVKDMEDARPDRSLYGSAPRGSRELREARIDEAMTAVSVKRRRLARRAGPAGSVRELH